MCNPHNIVTLKKGNLRKKKNLCFYITCQPHLP